MIALHQLFFHVCGQAHVWSLGGQELPLCQRCTGLYVGAACALALWLLFRPRPSNALLWIHGGALLLMVPFGYHLVPQSAEVRTLTGWLFSFGLVYFLLLLPAGRLRAGFSEHPAWYGRGAAAGTAVLIASLHLGGNGVAALLAWAAAAGLAALAFLAAVNILVLPGSFRRSSASAS